VTAPSVLALDFDGVVCDGMREYFESAWRAWTQLWGTPGAVAPPDLFERFAALRPLIESGWEMPLLISALMAGMKDGVIARDWTTLAPQLLGHHAAADVGACLDRVRDAWIAADRAGWLGHHRFYPGVIDRLRALAASATPVVIITTKEGRFIRELFAQEGLDVPADRIHGKEVKRPKADTLRALKAAGGPGLSVWFVEDRLQTLDGIATRRDLDDVRLFLAAWGYNFPAEREAARRDGRVRLLSPEDFVSDFSAWPGP
jgi:phosphoglycolate phosphatase-like HAD superfamily hydrolase